MGFYLIIVVMLLSFSCKSYKLLKEESIVSKHILYRTLPEKFYENTYTLYDGSVIHYTKDLKFIKDALEHHQLDYKKMPQSSFQPIFFNKINTTTPINYSKIKVLPLIEFGYLLKKDSTLTYYGLMGADSVFIDLTKNKVYGTNK